MNKRQKTTSSTEQDFQRYIDTALCQWNSTSKERPPIENKQFQIRKSRESCPLRCVRSKEINDRLPRYPYLKNISPLMLQVSGNKWHELPFTVMRQTSIVFNSPEPIPKTQRYDRIGFRGGYPRRKLKPVSTRKKQ